MGEEEWIIWLWSLEKQWITRYTKGHGESKDNSRRLIRLNRKEKKTMMNNKLLGEIKVSIVINIDNARRMQTILQ